MSAAIPEQDSGEALVGRECWVWDTCKASNWVEMQQARKRIVLNFTGSRFYPYRTNSEAPLLQEIYDHARPVELGHPDPNHPSHKETKMTELEQARKAYEELGAAKDPGFIKIVTEVAVLMEGRELFDESVTRIRIDDEGGGEFVVVSQCSKQPGQIKIDPHEWPTVREAIDEAMARCRS